MLTKMIVIMIMIFALLKLFSINYKIVFHIVNRSHCFSQKVIIRYTFYIYDFYYIYIYIYIYTIILYK